MLEGITEVPFPRSENLCTRFATEIIMRRDYMDSIQVKTIPDNARPESEKTKLAAFGEKIVNVSELLQLIAKATAFMGLNGTSDDLNTAKAFSRDVLSVEICRA